MQSTAKTVDEYLDEVPVGRRAALVRLRELFRTFLTDFEEEMLYGGPCYVRNGEPEAGFASQKNFIGVYILRLDVLDTHRLLLNGKGISVGKGAIRYSKPEHINFDVVEMMLMATQASTGVICGHNKV